MEKEQRIQFQRQESYREDRYKESPRNEGKKYPNLGTTGFQCFNCQRWIHKENECPNRINVILREGKIYFLREEVVLEVNKIDKISQD